jgi:DNA-binding CsgD family transcriptional regulator
MNARGSGPELGPGMLMFGADRRVESFTGSAVPWLSELGFQGSPAEDPLPYALLMIAERARATGEEVTARIIGSSGGWLQAHASPASGGPGRVALILQAATSPSMTLLISATYGLTARERELTELVIEGCKTIEIAERLYISPHTVQGHLKAIFTKTGVRSRRALVAKVHGFRRENR